MEEGRKTWWEHGLYVDPRPRRRGGPRVVFISRPAVRREWNCVGRSILRLQGSRWAGEMRGGKGRSQDSGVYEIFE